MNKRLVEIARHSMRYTARYEDPEVVAKKIMYAMCGGVEQEDIDEAVKAALKDYKRSPLSDEFKMDSV